MITNYKIERPRYDIHRASGTLKQLRDSEVELLTREKYTPGAESRIAFDYIKDPTDPEAVKAFDEHEEYVMECKATVDAEMERLRVESEGAV